MRAARAEILTLLEAEEIEASYKAVHALPPDLRIVIEPFITCHCLHTTANATANATCDIVRALTTGRDSLVAAQVKLEGETHDLNTVCGMPVVVNARGWSRVVCPDLAADEEAQLQRSCETIATNLATWRG